jgi:hypothetical protein
MNHAAVPRAAGGAAVLAAAMLLAAGPAHAGSTTVRDADGGQWSIQDDPAEDARDFLMRHLDHTGQPVPGFGRDGFAHFTVATTNDPPASVRVDASRRIWMVGASLAGNQPQPVVARFLPDGTPDARWGVQGKVQLSPAGVPVQPNDLLPLADGSVLVAGEVAGGIAPQAIVYHLLSGGTLDLDFGTHGLWRREGANEASTATSLAANPAGLVVVAVAVRGEKPAQELWTFNDVPPRLVSKGPLDDSSDGEDLRVDWAGQGWATSRNGGPTRVVPAALLSNRPAAAAPSPVPAASDPGQGGLNPFADTAASAPAAAPVDEGLPWPGIVVGGLIVAAAAGWWRTRRRGDAATPGAKAPVRR